MTKLALQVDERAPLGYLGPFSLEGVKDVTFEPNRLFDANFMNPYSDYYKNKGMDQLRPFQQVQCRADSIVFEHAYNAHPPPERALQQR